MPDIHTIRLREPWQCEPRGSTVLWSRSFNWPAGLTPREKVWVVIDDLPVGARVSLNGHPLTGDLEATRSVAGHNRLEIEIPGDATKFPLQVRLDIDEG